MAPPAQSKNEYPSKDRAAGPTYTRSDVESEQATSEPELPTEYTGLLICQSCWSMVHPQVRQLHDQWHAQFADPGNFGQQYSPIPEIVNLYRRLQYGVQPPPPPTPDADGH